MCCILQSVAHLNTKYDDDNANAIWFVYTRINMRIEKWIVNKTFWIAPTKQRKTTDSIRSIELNALTITSQSYF